MNDEKIGSAKVQWLIFGGIVSLILLVTGLAVSSARERARDYKRLSDVSRIQAGLELYFAQNNKYPVASEFVALGGSNARCLSSGGFGGGCEPGGSMFLNPVPAQTHIGLKKSGLLEYGYLSDGETYSITFIMEGDMDTVGIKGGVACAYPGEMMKSTTASSCALK